MRVKNLNGSGQGKSGNGSWLTHWEKLSGQNAWICYGQGCIGRPSAGGRVQKDSLIDRRWYVIPLCAACNDKNGQDLDIWDAARLVPANDAGLIGILNVQPRDLARWRHHVVQVM
jgi:hypothetical protein